MKPSRGTLRALAHTAAAVGRGRVLDQRGPHLGDLLAPTTGQVPWPSSAASPAAQPRVLGACQNGLRTGYSAGAASPEFAGSILPAKGTPVCQAPVGRNAPLILPSGPEGFRPPLSPPHLPQWQALLS